MFRYEYYEVNSRRIYKAGIVRSLRQVLYLPLVKYLALLCTSCNKNTKFGYQDILIHIDHVHSNFLYKSSVECIEVLDISTSLKYLNHHFVFLFTRSVHNYDRNPISN